MGTYKSARESQMKGTNPCNYMLFPIPAAVYADGLQGGLGGKLRGSQGKGISCLRSLHGPCSAVHQLLTPADKTYSQLHSIRMHLFVDMPCWAVHQPMAPAAAS